MEENQVKNEEKLSSSNKKMQLVVTILVLFLLVLLGLNAFKRASKISKVQEKDEVLQTKIKAQSSPAAREALFSERLQKANKEITEPTVPVETYEQAMIRIRAEILEKQQLD